MADLEELLVQTSRTFALSIPELPEPTRHEVRVAYLLFRFADTFEDATRWGPEERTGALAGFGRLLDPASTGEADWLAREWLAHPPLDHEGYLELLRETPAVLGALSELRPGAQASIRLHVSRTIEGMIRYAGRPGTLELRTIDELKEYCYVVAGIVGEMLTELFLLDRPELVAAAPRLRELARSFGEGLQLTNILRDASGDAEEGRSYVGQPAHRREAFGMAREDLSRAEEYVGLLQESGAPSGIVAFSALPVLLARETLDRVQSEGPGAKLTRPEVAGLVERMHGALDDNRPAIP